MISTIPEVHWRVFEDNPSALKLARTLKMRPRTKHINQVYHHFQDFVKNGTIRIFTIDSVNKIAEIFYETLNLEWISLSQR